MRAVFTEYEEHRLRENVKGASALWKVRAVFEPRRLRQAPRRAQRALKPLGEVISTLPSSQPGDEASIAFDLVFGSSRAPRRDRSTVLEAVAAVAAAGRTLGPAAPPPTEARALATTPSPPAARRPSATSPRAGAPVPGAAHARCPDVSLRSLTQTVRVDIGRLDGLMNTVGELLLIRSNIDRLADRRAAAGVTLPKLWGQELQRETRALERKLDELQKGILEVRMVPLGQVFDKLARLVRRLRARRARRSTSTSPAATSSSTS